jgi:hypothetical protein
VLSLGYVALLGGFRHGGCVSKEQIGRSDVFVYCGCMCSVLMGFLF